MPKLSSADAATIAATELTHALQNPAPAAPFLKLGDEQLDAIKQLAKIFNTSTQQLKSDTHPLPRVKANKQCTALPAPQRVAAPVQPSLLANDLGRLAQGVGTRMPSGTNTIFFIP